MSKLWTLICNVTEIIKLRLQQSAPENQERLAKIQSDNERKFQLGLLEKEIKNAQKNLEKAIVDCDRYDIEYWSGIVRNKQAVLTDLSRQ